MFAGHHNLFKSILKSACQEFQKNICSEAFFPQLIAVWSVFVGRFLKLTAFSHFETRETTNLNNFFQILKSIRKLWWISTLNPVKNESK